MDVKGVTGKPPEVVRPNYGAGQPSTATPDPISTPPANPPRDAATELDSARRDRATGSTETVATGTAVTRHDAPNGTLTIGGRQFDVYVGDHPPAGFVNIAGAIGANVPTFVRGSEAGAARRQAFGVSGRADQISFSRR